MIHLTDDELLLVHYRESVETDHLDACAECRARLATLRDVLALATGDAVPEPPADYEERVWQRLQFQIRKRPLVRWWIPAAAAALLAFGFVGGRLFEQFQKPVAPTVVASHVVKPEPPSADARLAFAASDHLDRSSRLLLEVANGGEATGDLVAANRLYRVMAERAGASDVARLLDELEPILLELAHAEGKEDLAAIRKRIEERELLFKLRVVRADALGEQKKKTTSIRKDGRT